MEMKQINVKQIMKQIKEKIEKDNGNDYKNLDKESNIKEKRIITSHRKIMGPILVKIRNFLNMLSDREVDKIFDLLKNEKIRKLILEHGDMDKPGKLVKAVLGNPELLIGYLPYLRYLW